MTQSKKTRSLTIKALVSRSPWEIAQSLGLGYSGDMSTIPHGGYYYSVADWSEYGYAECVKFTESEGTLYLESGTINKPKDIRPAMECCGWSPDSEIPGNWVQNGHSVELSPEMAIECAEAYRGMDIEQAHTFKSDNGKDYGNFPEWQIMRAARPWILGLAPAPAPVTLESKLPRAKELAQLIKALKRDIGPDYRAFEDDDRPGMQLTIGWNELTGEWSYQTGDNSYSGSAYHYPIWAVVGVYRRSNSVSVANDILSQLGDQSQLPYSSELARA